MTAATPDDRPQGDQVDADTPRYDKAKDIEKEGEITQDATDEESGTPPCPPPVQELERWNETGVNVFRFFSTLYCFILMGMTDGAVGVCLASFLLPNVFC